MIIEGELQPATIKRGVKVTDIASCSCDHFCSHRTICAIDSRSRVYLSTDAKKFTANKDLSKKSPIAGLFSTAFGAIILRSDMSFDPIETPRLNASTLERALKATNKLQKENPKLSPKVVDIGVAQNEAVIVLGDGTVVASSTWKRFSSLPQDATGPDPEIEPLSAFEMIIPGDKLRDSKGHRVIKSVETSLAIVLIFEDSNEFIVFDLLNRKLIRVTTDVKVENVSIIKGRAFITSTENKIHRVKSLQDHISEESNETLKTQPPEESTEAKRIWTRGKPKVELLGPGKVKIYPTKSRFKKRYSGEERIDPVTAHLPCNVKNLTLTNNDNFSTRVNILTEDGELFAVHFRW